MKKLNFKKSIIDFFWISIILYSMYVLIKLGYENRILLYKMNGSYIDQFYELFLTYSVLSIAYIIISAICIYEKIEKYFK